MLKKSNISHNIFDENKRSRVISMGKFGPRASDFGYEICTIFLVKIRDLVQPHRRSWTGFDLLIILGLNSDDFPFYPSSLGRLEPEC